MKDTVAVSKSDMLVQFASSKYQKNQNPMDVGLQPLKPAAPLDIAARSIRLESEALRWIVILLVATHRMRDRPTVL